MPRANDAGGSNALGTPEWFEQKELLAAAQAPAEPEEDPSVGTSSLTSESKLDTSGSGTGTLHPSPAPDAENLSGKDQAPKPVPSSVSSTGGSGQETSSDPASQPGSSVESVPPKQATAVQPSSAAEAVDMARDAFNEGKYDAAEGFLDMAAAADATMLPDIQRYRDSIGQARQAHTTSQETPSTGGFATGGTVS